MLRYMVKWAFRVAAVWVCPSYVFRVLKRERCWYRIEYPNNESKMRLMVSMGAEDLAFTEREFTSFRHAANEMTALLFVITTHSTAAVNNMLYRRHHEMRGVTPSKNTSD